ncbi:MAG: hypothetical protein QNI87_14270 [Erythrobacter sp.]|uniref:hypothetical protein n=1 Tax=Erythrobacter sp. TaxID=1042 RepID=UPI00260B0D12|nr:hypothetical protein [Erythrobacter sp.]MDJ0979688.1 hypothetical protein [Erythrobacter sp.]
MPRPLAFALPIALFTSAAPALAEPEVLTAAEIRKEIIDVELKGKRFFMTATIFHSSDGTSKIRAPVRKRDGTWEIKGNELCITWEKEDETDCVRFERRGEGKYRIEPLGLNIEAKS